MTSTTRPLIDYLERHEFIDQEMAQTLRGTPALCDVREALQASGLFTYEELERLESLFSGFPLLHHPPASVDPSVQSQIPYHVSQRNRVVCIHNKDGALCVVTDQPYIDEDVLSACALERIERVPHTVIDRYLKHYQEQTRQSYLNSIHTLAKRVRTVDSYGSWSMVSLFPHDYKREIAEDLSSMLLLRRLVAVADLEHASAITIRPSHDKIKVTLRVDNQEQELAILDKGLESALYLKLRYLSDMSLEHIQSIEQSIAYGLASDYHIPYGVMFVPHAAGTTMVINNNRIAHDQSVLTQAGFSARDVALIQECIQNKSGMVIMSGISGSGKTFATYQLLEACARRYRVATLEDAIEYTINGVDQVRLSKRPEKDIALLQEQYEVVGVLPLHEGLVQQAYNVSTHRVLVCEAIQGVMSVIKKLLALDITPYAIARRLKLNVVSYRLLKLDSAIVRTRLMDTSECATIEQYCSIRDFNQELQLRGMRDESYRHWGEVPLAYNYQAKTPWWMRPFKQSRASQDSQYHFVRSVVELGKVITHAHEVGDSMRDLEQAVKHEQKKKLALGALVDCYGGVIGLEEVVAMLRT